MNHNIKTFAKSFLPRPVKKAVQESFRRVLIPPLLVRNLLAHDGTFIVDVLGHDLVVQHTNRWIENDLFWHGIYGYEGTSMRAWLVLARRARTIIDVGANTGIFSLAARCANVGAAIHSFEPVPEFYSILERNNNSNQARIVVHRSALSNEAGVLPMFMPDEFAGNVYSTSLSKGHYLKHQKSVPRTFDVAVEIFDVVARQCAIENIDLIKVDAEGFDLNVLRGMEQSLVRWTPDVLVEVQSDEIGAGIETLLPANRYRYFHIREEGTFIPTEHLKASAALNYLVCKLTSAELLSAEIKSFSYNKC